MKNLGIILGAAAAFGLGWLLMRRKKKIKPQEVKEEIKREIPKKKTPRLFSYEKIVEEYTWEN